MSLDVSLERDIHQLFAIVDSHRVIMAHIGPGQGGSEGAPRLTPGYQPKQGVCANNNIAR